MDLTANMNIAAIIGTAVRRFGTATGPISRLLLSASVRQCAISMTNECMCNALMVPDEAVSNGCRRRQLLTDVAVRKSTENLSR